MTHRVAGPAKQNPKTNLKPVIVDEKKLIPNKPAKAGRKITFAHQRDLIRTFHTSFLTFWPLWIHNARIQIQKVILY